MSKSITVKLITLNKGTKRCRYIFKSRSQLKTIIKEFKKIKIPVYGQFNNSLILHDINVPDISHKIKDLFIKKDCLYAKIKILNTQRGKDLKRLFRSTYFVITGISESYSTDEKERINGRNTFTFWSVDAKLQVYDIIISSKIK